MKVLVAGGAGFIGSHTVDRLVKEGMEVAVVDNLSTGCAEYVHPKAAFFQLDLEDQGLREVFHRFMPEACIHLGESPGLLRSKAAMVGTMNPDMRGLIHLLDLCREFGVGKLIYGSSAEVYGTKEAILADESHLCSPRSPLGLSKLAPEEYIKAFSQLFGLDYTILRYTSVYGTRMTHQEHLMANMLYSMVGGTRPQLYGKNTQSWDFIHVSDAAEANVLALSKGGKETVNIGTGRLTTVDELMQILQNKFNAFIRPVYKPARAEDKLHVGVSIDKLRSAWGWEPQVRLEEGLVMLAGEIVYRSFMDKLKDIPSGNALRSVPRKKWARKSASV